MTYKLIIQELKESSDHNVRTFVREVERMKRLTTQRRHYYLTNRYEPGAVRILMKDYIPYIIKVAYGYKEKTTKLSLLDLVNEGMVGVYAAIEKYNYQGRALSVIIRKYIAKYIINVAEKNGCTSKVDFYTHSRAVWDETIDLDDLHYGF